MVTELQRRFARSKILRRLILEHIAAELGGVNGYKRVLSACIADAYKDTPEPQIKALLYQFLQCYDLPAEYRAEILQLLQLSSTALTKRQRRQLALYLQAE